MLPSTELQRRSKDEAPGLRLGSDPAPEASTLPTHSPAPPYGAHPSEALNRAFAARPYQGAEPEAARFLFVGLDANYSPTIEQSAVFERILDYLNDGVAFWKLY